LGVEGVWLARPSGMAFRRPRPVTSMALAELMVCGHRGEENATPLWQ